MDHENKQTKRLNKKIDHIQTAVDHISLIADIENRKLINLLQQDMSSAHEKRRGNEVYQPIQPWIFSQSTNAHLIHHKYGHLLSN